MKPPLRLSPLSEEQLDELKELYRTTKDVRLRTRSQMILLAAEQGMIAPTIAQIVGESDQTVRNWFKRYQAEGIEGLKDAPMPGASLLPVDAGSVSRLPGGTDGHPGGGRDRSGSSEGG